MKQFQYTSFVNLSELNNRNLSERFLKKMCLLISVLGLMLIYVVEIFVVVPYTEIADITKDDVGENVRLCGTVDKRYVSAKGDVFLDLVDDSGIRVVFFNNGADLNYDQYLEKSKVICLEGVVKLYDGNLEVIGERLLIDSRE